MYSNRKIKCLNNRIPFFIFVGNISPSPLPYAIPSSFLPTLDGLPLYPQEAHQMLFCANIAIGGIQMFSFKSCLCGNPNNIGKSLLQGFFLTSVHWANFFGQYILSESKSSFGMAPVSLLLVRLIFSAISWPVEHF